MYNYHNLRTSAKRPTHQSKFENNYFNILVLGRKHSHSIINRLNIFDCLSIDSFIGHVLASLAMTELVSLNSFDKNLQFNNVDSFRNSQLHFLQIKVNGAETSVF